MFSKNLSIFLKFLGAEAPSLSVRGRGETDYINIYFVILLSFIDKWK
ncbi:MAG: hypothetical protein Ct9H90mP19_0780 [Gammaproteobacteria bacterium]|nr:MAG: hypothetical protein Ct9H90mP19_0780 [Gammaproteobacteria bacterium]